MIITRRGGKASVALVVFIYSRTLLNAGGFEGYLLFAWVNLFRLSRATLTFFCRSCHGLQFAVNSFCHPPCTTTHILALA